MMLRKLAAANALAILAATPGALAAPIVVNPGENVFFNFDLTGAVPGPVYEEIRMDTNVSGYDGGREVGPPPSTFVGSGNLNATVIASTDVGVVDGIFSVQIVLLAGSASSITVDPFAIGVITTVDGQEVTTGSVPPVGVPEPATLALLGIGLAGLGLRRRKRVA